MKNASRMILQFDFPIAAKAAKTVAKRAARLQEKAKKRGAKLRLLIPGLILYTSTLRALNIKIGPNDKKTGEPRYRIFRGKMSDVDPNAKPVKPAKAAKVKPVKAARKLSRKVRRTRKAAAAPVTAPAPAAAPVAAPAATAETTPPPVAPGVTPALATELADSAAASTPAAERGVHARRSRKGPEAAPAAPAPTAATGAQS